jgi:Tfp pilus assembly protein PilF
MQGTPEAAIEVLERALFAAPSDLRLRKDLASLLISVHRKVDARQLIASASTSGLIDPELVQLQVEAAAEDDPDVERTRQLARFLDPVANAI